MFKKENIKRVCAQKQRVISLEPMVNFDMEEYTRERIAKEIGMEMMRNNLIEFTTENDGTIVTTRAIALVYDKNEKSEE